MKRIFALLLVLCLSISVFAVALTACDNNDTTGGTNNSGNTSENGDNVFTQGITYDRFYEIVLSADNITATRNKVDYANTAGITVAYQYENTAAYLDGDNVHHYLEYYYALEKDQKLKHMEYIFIEDDCTYTISGLNYGISSSGEVYILPEGEYEIDSKSKCQTKYFSDTSQSFIDAILRLFKKDEKGLLTYNVQALQSEFSDTISDISLELKGTEITLFFVAEDDDSQTSYSFGFSAVNATEVNVPDEYKNTQSYPWKKSVSYNGVNYELTTKPGGEQVYTVTNTPDSDDLVEATINGISVEYKGEIVNPDPDPEPEPEPTDLDSFIKAKKNFCIEQNYTLTQSDGSSNAIDVNIYATEQAIITLETYTVQNGSTTEVVKEYQFIFVYENEIYLMTLYNYNPDPSLVIGEITISGEKLYLLMNYKMSMSHYDEVFNADYSQTLYDYINGTPKIGNTVIADDCGMNIGQPTVEFDATILNVAYSADDGNGKSVLTSIKKYGVGTTNVDIPDELYTYTKTSTAVEA